MRTRNITLRLPEPLLRRLRAYAAQRNSSPGALMAEAIRQMLDEDGSRDARHRRIVERMHNAPDWGTRGKITWTREELGTH